MRRVSNIQRALHIGPYRFGLQKRVFTFSRMCTHGHRVAPVSRFMRAFFFFYNDFNATVHRNQNYNSALYGCLREIKNGPFVTEIFYVSLSLFAFIIDYYTNNFA